VQVLLASWQHSVPKVTPRRQERPLQHSAIEVQLVITMLQVQSPVV
jgi:hypothetical protein